MDLSSNNGIGVGQALAWPQLPPFRVPTLIRSHRYTNTLRCQTQRTEYSSSWARASLQSGVGATGFEDRSWGVLGQRHPYQTLAVREGFLEEAGS